MLTLDVIPCLMLAVLQMSVLVFGQLIQPALSIPQLISLKETPMLMQMEETRRVSQLTSANQRCLYSPLLEHTCKGFKEQLAKRNLQNAFQK